MTADDLRAVGYTIDDTTPGTWTVSGIGRTWTFPSDDDATIRAVYELALTADNVSLRTQAENAVATLTDALDSWDVLDDAQVKAVTKTAIQVVANLTRLTIRRYGS